MPTITPRNIHDIFAKSRPRFERLLARLDRCEIYHMVDEGSKTMYGVKISNNKSYPSIPDLTDVHCYWHQTSDNIPDTDDAHPNRTNYTTYSVYFSQAIDVRLNDKAVFEGKTYYFKTVEKLSTVAWEVLAVREVDV